MAHTAGVDERPRCCWERLVEEVHVEDALRAGREAEAKEVTAAAAAVMAVAREVVLDV